MKCKITLIKIFLIILITVIASSCKNANVTSNEKIEVQNLNISSIENHLKYLTSSECDGRLVGTEGNLNAQNYIIKCLSDIGINPYEQKYEQVFSYDHMYINDVSLKVNGKEFDYEKDYRVYVIPDKKSIKINEIYNNECETVFLQKENELSDGKVKIEILKLELDRLNKRLPAISNITNCTSIGVIEEIYDILKEKNDVKIDFSIDYDMKQVTANNIVGIISNGMENTSAIVLSAHFDHVGSLGENVFEGALDNASGTCTLLNAAKILYEKAETSTLKKDIIIAFFNSEENGLNGSREFAKQLSAKYDDVININFDCINEADKNHIDTTNDNLGNLVDLNEFMKKVGITENKTCVMRSDHHSFENGISIGFADDTVHTLRDVSDNISIESIARVSEGAAEFALDYAYKESNHSNSGVDVKSDVDLKYEKIWYEQEQLKFGEYKYIDINDEIVLVEQNEFITEDAELIKKEFEFMNVFDNYDKMRLFICFRKGKESNYVTDYELGKVYKKDLNEYNDIDFVSMGIRVDDVNFQINKFENESEKKGYEYFEKEKGENMVAYDNHELYSKFSNEMGNVLEYFKEDDEFSYSFTFQYFKFDSKMKMIDDIEETLKLFKENDIFNVGNKFIELFNK